MTPSTPNAYRALFLLALCCALALPAVQLVAPAASEASLGKKDGLRQRPKLPEPKQLPAAARQLIRARMQNHADDMDLLVASVVMLNPEMTAMIAGNIARQPRLARPLPGADADLNARIPTAFFDLSDALRKQAQGLVAAAEARDYEAISESFGALATTCVRCHKVYID